MASFDEFLDALKDRIGALVDDLDDHKDEILSASKAFLIESDADLKKWTKQLADDEISRDDFEFLAKGLSDLAEVHLHANIGLAKVALDRFRNSLINLIVDTAFDIFL